VDILLAVDRLVGQIERSAAASGVLLSRIEVAPGSLSESLSEKPAPASSGAGEGTDVGDVAQKVQLKVTLSSDYKSLLQFLNNMLSLSRVITIRDLSVSAASSSSGESSQIRISLTFDAYWKPLPKQLASIESPIAELTPSESARLENVQLTGFVTPPTVPEVSKGKPDLFAPF
jgi:Tfp pilus assembly protein PilO